MIKFMNKTSLLATFCCVFMISCESDYNFEINNPTTYSFERNGFSTVSFKGQTERIGMATELMSAMIDFDNSEEALLEMFRNQTANSEDANPFYDASLNASTKSVKSKVAASADFFSSNATEAAVIKADIEAWIIGQTQEIARSSNQLAQAGQAGQIADGGSVRFVNARGLEYNQAVAKSLIGALMVDQICNNYLSTAVLDADQNREDNENNTLEEGQSYTTIEHKWDEAYGYLFGAASDASDPLSTLGEDDAFLNKYLSRVEDDSDFAGIATDIFEAFKLGRAAIVAGDYETRDAQAAILRERISEVIAIRAVYYLQKGKNALAVATSDLNKGGAFHDLSEGFGFIYSLRFTRQSDKNEAYFSREEVDGFISQLTAGNGFWDVNATTLDQMSEEIADKFSFTVTEAAE